MTTTAVNEISVEDFLTKFHVTEQSKMKAVIAATSDADPYTGLQKLFGFQRMATGTMRCHYLPQKMQRELLDICKSCDHSVPIFFARKIGLVFQRYYPGKIKLPTLIRSMKECSWDVYRAAINIARKCGLDNEAIKTIVPLRAGRFNVVIVAKNLDDKSTKMVQILEGTARDKTHAVFLQTWARNPESEERARVFMGLEKDAYLFGLESPVRKCVEVFCTTYFEAVCHSNQEPSAFTLVDLSRVFFQQLYLNAECRKLWEMLPNLENEFFNLEIFRVYFQLDGYLKKIKSPSDIPELDLSNKVAIKLLRALFEFSIKTYGEAFTKDELEAFKNFLNNPTLSFRQLCSAMQEERRPEEMAKSFLSPAVEPNLFRITVVGRDHFSSLKKAMGRVLEGEFDEWNSPKPKLESKVESKAESKGDGKAASSAGAAAAPKKTFMHPAVQALLLTEIAKAEAAKNAGSKS
ncbi:MAG: hypothetical protein HYX48_07355 [Chlamydiales bacterium]|nr:hypothetical protein [Chlamydiales bacterium]